MGSQNQKDFSKKHPVVNILLGLFCIVVLAFVALVIVAYMLQKIGNALIWVAEIAVTLDAVVLVTIITGGVSIAGVVISSIFAKLIEYRKARNEYLAQKREEPYGAFVDMVYKLQKNVKEPGTYSNDDMLLDLSRFSKQITLWGSADVVNKWVEFRSIDSPEKKKDIMFIMEDIMNAMRKDLGLKKVKKGNLLAFFVNDIKKELGKAKKEIKRKQPPEKILGSETAKE